MTEIQKDLLIAAYSQMQENLRAIRARMHTNVHLAVTLFAAGAAFFLNLDTTPRAEVRYLTAVGFLTLGAALGFVQKAQQSTVVDIFEIQDQLEIAMGFHTPDGFIPGRTLYPAEFAPGTNRGTRGLVRFYDLVIFGSAILAAIAILLP